MTFLFLYIHKNNYNIMYDNNLIYCLKCPFTDNVHYVGKSTQGLSRPTQHLTKSHSNKITDWVNDIGILGYQPKIEVLESNISPNEIDDKEKYWIAKFLKNDALLLNSSSMTYAKIINNIIDESSSTNDDVTQDNILMNNVSKLIKKNRKKLNLTQTELSSKYNISLRWIRKVESGNNSIMLNHLEKLLKKFHLKLIVVSDLYE